MLLMFGVGLHFSLDDLLAVRKIAFPGRGTDGCRHWTRREHCRCMGMGDRRRCGFRFGVVGCEHRCAAEGA